MAKKSTNFNTTLKTVWNETEGREISLDFIWGVINKVSGILDTMGYRRYDLTSIHFNNRMRSTCAMTIHKKQADTWHIEFSTFYIKNASMEGIINTIAHEVVHTVEGCFDHQTKFQSIGIKLRKYGYNVQTHDHDVAFSQAYKEKKSLRPYWLVRCMKCEKEIKPFYRKTETIKGIIDDDLNFMYQCPYCHNHGCLRVYHFENGVEVLHHKIRL